MGSKSSALAQHGMSEILNSCRVLPRHYGLWGLAAGGTLLDGMSLAALAIALPLIKQTYSMSPLMVGAVSAGSVVGMAVGAMAGGWTSDRIGRRHLFLLSMSLIAVASLGSAIAWTPTIILISQFLLGCGQGSEFPNSSTYVSEIMPQSVRNRMLVATITMQSIGMLIGVSLGFLLLRAFPHVDTWRYFLGSRVAVAALFFIVRYVSMPESPIWLMSRGRNKEAATAIDALAPDQRDQLTKLGIQAGDQPFRSDEHPEGSPTGFGVLFSRRYIRRTALAAGAWMLMDISTYGVGHFAPSVLATLFSGAKGGGAIAAEFSSIQGSFALDSFLLLGFLLGMWLVPRFGELKMQRIGFLGMVVGMGILFVAVGSRGDAKSANMVLVIAGFCIFNLMMNMGPNSTTFGLPALLFPSEIRATAAGFSAACAKTGATLGTLFLPMIGKSIGLGNTLALLAGISALGFVVTAVLGAGLLGSQVDEGASTQSTAENAKK
jgi:putative MFS transporter